ncbi:MAG: type II toxin-antitoxin system RelE/ParE family toxin [Amylibacter sp.]|nr:type II toxin-antitoxin system RelE/ParE family toxin [Amylibacter sp.]
MKLSFRLTRRAETSLVDIALWTIETFGQHQADVYGTELIARCEAIARGEVASRSCSVLIDKANNLRYARAGEHFVVYLDHTNEVIIVDILHSRSDLPRHISALSSVQNEKT